MPSFLRFSLFLLVALAAACASSTAGPAVVGHSQATDQLSSSIAQALSDASNHRLALLPLEAEGEVALEVGGLIAEQIAAELANLPQITLVERDKLGSVMDEIALQQSGLIDESQQIEVGKLAGAQWLLSLRASRVGETVALTATLLDVEAGTTLLGKNMSVAYDEQMKAAVADRAKRQNIGNSPEVLAAFTDVRNGQYDDAKELFTTLSETSGNRRAVGLMGLAAIALEQGNYAQTKQLCEAASQGRSETSYCLVLQGKVAYQQGHLAQANAYLQRAAQAEGTLLSWQRSQAHNLLGLMSSDPSTAITHFEQAVELDATNSSAMGNHANILETTGDVASAIKLYQRGLKLQPNDKVLNLLLRDAEMRAAFSRDQARQQQIATVAADLIANQEKGKRAADRKDKWKSSTITLTLLPLEEKGAPAGRMGERAFIQAAMQSLVEDVPGFEVVDRQLLGKVLEELQLSSSQLGRSDTALKVGEILAARVMLGGSLVRMDGETQITLKLIETESTRILASINQIFEPGTRLSEIVKELEKALHSKLRTTFPRRARILTQEGQRVLIDLGSDLGIESGKRFNVLGNTGKKARATGTVAEVSANSAWLTLDRPRKGLQGARVEESVN